MFVQWLILHIYQVLFLRFYLFIHERHRKKEEKQPPCTEPDMGLDPGTLGSCPEPKADTQPLSHPGIPCSNFINGQELRGYEKYFKV